MGLVNASGKVEKSLILKLNTKKRVTLWFC